MKKVQPPKQPKKPCGKCKNNVTDIKHPGLSCVTCKKFFHFTCVNIDRTAEDKIADLKLSWDCATCVRKPGNRRSTIVPSAVTNEAPFVPTTNSPSIIEKRLEEILAAFANYRQITDDRIASLEQQLSSNLTITASLTNSVKSVDSKTEDWEKASLETCLEIQGLPESELAEPQQAAALVAEAIECVLPQEVDCVTVHSGSRKALKLHFASKSARNAFLKAGKHFNKSQKRVFIEGQHHKIFVNESLTKAQKALLYNAKILVRERNYMCAWFVNGQVHIKENITAIPKIIRSQIQLEDFDRNEAENILPERERNSLQDRQPLTSN